MVTTTFEQLYQRDIEYFDYLKPGIEAGTIIYDTEVGKYFKKIITNFPIECSRIAWWDIPNRKLVHMKVDQSIYRERVVTFLKEVQAILPSKPKQVILVFDGYTKGAFKMSYEDLMEYADEIFPLPQHTYVIPEDASWCINYTFEDILYFSFSTAGERAPASE